MNVDDFNDKCSSMMWRRQEQTRNIQLEGAENRVNQGKASADDLFFLARHHRHTTHNYRQAIKYYEESARSGYPKASLDLIRLYLQGDSFMNIKPDYDLALHYATSGLIRCQGQPGDEVKELQNYFDMIRSLKAKENTYG